MAKRSETASPDLNLIPIMNLVTLLIPFLLMSAQFVAYAVIDSSLPPLCERDCGSPDDTPATVRLALTTDGYRLVATGPELAEFEEGVDIDCVTPGCPGPAEEAWDTTTLRAQLTRIKDLHPEVRGLVLTAEDGVPYEALILAMDATREDPAQGGRSGGGCSGRCLFPDVVLASAVGELE